MKRILFKLKLALKNIWINRFEVSTWRDAFQGAVDVGLIRWVVVTLKNGETFFGRPRMYSDSPNGDHLYLEAVSKVDDDGKYIEIENTHAILIPQREILYIEFVQDESDKKHDLGIQPNQ
jgi:hypothetical protein